MLNCHVHKDFEPDAKLWTDIRENGWVIEFNQEAWFNQEHFIDLNTELRTG